MRCPHCGNDLAVAPERPPTATEAEVIAFLEDDPRRDIYETASRKGVFTVSYGKGKSPMFTRDVAEAVERAGYVYENFKCRGWFERKKK